VLSVAQSRQATESRLGLRGVRRVALITVNATGQMGEAAALRRTPPGLVEMATLSSSVLVAENAAENRILLKELLGKLARPEPGAAPLATYWIDVDLAAVADVLRRDRLRAIPTSMTVNPPLVSELICSAHDLLAASEQYRRLLSDLAGSVPSGSGCSPSANGQ
jgi:hypothetical protein